MDSGQVIRQALREVHLLSPRNELESVASFLMPTTDIAFVAHTTTAGEIDSGEKSDDGVMTERVTSRVLPRMRVMNLTSR